MCWRINKLRDFYTVLNTPLLSEADEHNLVEDWLQTKNVHSINHLITAHIKLVVSMAIKMRRPHIDFIDLVYEGIAGITEAAHRFDPQKGGRFSGYAKIWAKLYMRNYIFNSWSIVKIGTQSDHKNIFFNWGRLRNKEQNYDDELKEDELNRMSSELKIPKKDIVHIAKRFTGSDLSLDAPIGNQQHFTLENLICDTQAPDEDALLKQADYEHIREAIHLALSQLNKEEVDIIQSHWLEGRESISEISERLSLSKEYIRHTEQKALRKLRPYLMPYAGRIRSYLD